MIIANNGTSGGGGGPEGAKPHDAVLMDIQMLVMDGSRQTAEIRAMGRGTGRSIHHHRVDPPTP